MQDKKKFIRNFNIIAHIAYRKSTFIGQNGYRT